MENGFFSPSTYQRDQLSHCIFVSALNLSPIPFLKWTRRRMRNSPFNEIIFSLLTFPAGAQFLCHVERLETTVQSYCCLIYFCAFRLPLKWEFCLLCIHRAGSDVQNLLQLLWRHLELFLALWLDKMASEEWRYIHVLCNKIIRCS